MKVELKQIIDHLTDALGLVPGLKVAAVIDDDGETIIGWTVVNVEEDGTIKPINKTMTLKELFDIYKR